MAKLTSVNLGTVYLTDDELKRLIKELRTSMMLSEAGIESLSFRDRLLVYGLREHLNVAV